MNNTTPTVLHVVLSLEYGGMEQVVVDLVRLSKNSGQHAKVLCLERPGELAEPLVMEGAEVHCLNKLPGIQLKLRAQIAQLLDQIRPDILHTHQIGALFYSGPPAVRHGVRAIVHTEHGKEYNFRRRTRWLGWLAARYADRFCCVSEDTAKHVLQHGIVSKDKIQVIYNGVDIDRFFNAASLRNVVRDELGIPHTTILIGTVGRLSEIKRQDVLIEAFARSEAKNYDCHLMLVGDGPKRSALVELTNKLDISSRVHFMGFRADRERYLAAMDVFALTSDSEGTPLALLEAWAVGLPVVVTAVGGMPELVAESITGMLAPRGDAVTLSHIFQEMICDRQLRRRLIDGGRDFVRLRFDRRTMASEYNKLYTDLLYSP